MRKTKLVDCNPSWVEYYSAAGQTDAIMFECPEGHEDHEDCKHVIPFTPALDGSPTERYGAQWQRTGDTFETLSLTPSIARRPRHASREAAIAAGCIAEYVTESMLCAFHGFITNGEITFCGDSR